MAKKIQFTPETDVQAVSDTPVDFTPENVDPSNDSFNLNDVIKLKPEQYKTYGPEDKTGPEQPPINPITQRRDDEGFWSKALNLPERSKPDRADSAMFSSGLDYSKIGDFIKQHPDIANGAITALGNILPGGSAITNLLKPETKTSVAAKLGELGPQLVEGALADPVSPSMGLLHAPSALEGRLKSIRETPIEPLPAPTKLQTTLNAEGKIVPKPLVSPEEFTGQQTIKALEGKPLETLKPAVVEQPTKIDFVPDTEATTKPGTVNIPEGMAKFTLKNPTSEQIAELQGKGYVVSNRSSKSATFTNNPKITALVNNDLGVISQSTTDRLADHIKGFIKDPEGSFKPKELVEGTKKALLKLRGKSSDEVDTIRTQLLSHLVDVGRIDVNAIYGQVKDKLSPTQFDKVLNDIIDSGDLQKAYKSKTLATRASDTSPMQMQPTANPDAQQAMSALMDKIKANVVARNEQDALVRAEKSKRFTAAEGVSNQPGGYFEALQKLKGKYPKVSPNDLSDAIHPTDISALQDQIMSTPKMDIMDKINTVTALRKATGQLPMEGALQPNEIKLLQNTFGPQLTSDLQQLHSGLGFPTGNGALQKVIGVANDARSIKTSTDIGWPYRQGKFYAHTPIWWKSVFKSIPAYFSKESAEGSLAAIRNDTRTVSRINMETGQLEDVTRYQYWKDAKLGLTDFHGKNPLYKEENLPSDIGDRLEKLGVLGKTAAFPIQSSDRAITVGMDNLRYLAANKLMDNLYDFYNKSKELAVKTGASEKTIRDLEQWNPQNISVGGKLVDIINNSTARGKLPAGMEGWANGLNTILFSPKMKMGNIRTLAHIFNPLTYLNAPKPIRNLAMQNAMSLASTIAAGYGIAKAYGYVTGTPTRMGTDIDSSDFAKMVIGKDTRLDPTGGLTPIVVPLVQAGTGVVTSINGKSKLTGSYGTPKGTSILENSFIDNSLAPGPSLIAALINRAEVGGRPINLTSMNPFENTVTRQLINPMLVQDAYEAAWSDPKLAPLLFFDSMGMSLNTYDKRVKGEKPQIPNILKGQEGVKTLMSQPTVVSNYFGMKPLLKRSNP